MKRDYEKPQIRLFSLRTTILLSGSDNELHYGGTGSGPVEAPAWAEDGEE